MVFMIDDHVMAHCVEALSVSCVHARLVSRATQDYDCRVIFWLFSCQAANIVQYERPVNFRSFCVKMFLNLQVVSQLRRLD